MNKYAVLVYTHNLGLYTIYPVVNCISIISLVMSARDKVFADYIKNYIKHLNLPLEDLMDKLTQQFSKEEIMFILDGSYIYGLSDFYFIIDILNIPLENVCLIMDCNSLNPTLEEA